MMSFRLRLRRVCAIGWTLLRSSSRGGCLRSRSPRYCSFDRWHGAAVNFRSGVLNCGFAVSGWMRGGGIRRFVPIVVRTIGARIVVLRVVAAFVVRRVSVVHVSARDLLQGFVFALDCLHFALERTLQFVRSPSELRNGFAERTAQLR